ncbi:VWA domain-containing protein [Treponema denticola]|uniref:vWA domain-containing protein n=1 Tax=Treponema denticola TaxID=158 RepID=UPI0020A5516C|nr:vWA domain-containing protein [Treponema denticola]UTC93938.1 VWA domain-containing protein [Treponema denticola]UTC96443.1 VWA domain-containing protein [Treponema denticola]
MQKRKFLWILVVGFLSVFLEAEDLSLSKEDLLVIQNPKGGYHLYIKAKPDIKSVLLTETTKDPDLKLDNYAYRDPNYNEINGDEKRLLNGEFLLPEKKLYSLIDSTPEKNTPLGEAYHIWIPYIILYGYDWSRSGEIEVKDGTFFNIRTFAKPYGDYTGNFQDNPFTLRVTQKPVEKDPPPDLSYSDEAVKTFTDLADTTEGEMIYAKGPEDILSTIKEILKKGEKDHLDLLFALDSTESMKDDVEEVRKNISSMLAETLPQYKTYRIALVLYKDYREDFLVREACVFTDNLKKFEKALYGFKVFGGRDIPEAVYEGIFLGLRQSWRALDADVDKKLILIGDAPPHPKPRGKVTKEDVDKLAAEKGVKIYPIILPHTLSY